jgi:hypothetical protein
MHEGAPHLGVVLPGARPQDVRPRLYQDTKGREADLGWGAVLQIPSPPADTDGRCCTAGDGVASVWRRASWLLPAGAAGG